MLRIFCLLLCSDYFFFILRICQYDKECVSCYSTTGTSLHTFPGGGPSWALVAAGWGRAVAAGLAQGAAEVFVHHRTDVSLEVGEEDAPWADVLSLRRLLLLGCTVLLLYSGRRMAGEQVSSTDRLFLHFGIESQFLKQNFAYYL